MTSSFNIFWDLSLAYLIFKNKNIKIFIVCLLLNIHKQMKKWRSNLQKIIYLSNNKQAKSNNCKKNLIMKHKHLRDFCQVIDKLKKKSRIQKTQIRKFLIFKLTKISKKYKMKKKIMINFIGLKGKISFIVHLKLCKIF